MKPQEDLTPQSTKAILDAFAKGEKPKPGPQSGRQTSENSAGLTSLTTKVRTHLRHDLVFIFTSLMVQENFASPNSSRVTILLRDSLCIRFKIWISFSSVVPFPVIIPVSALTTFWQSLNRVTGTSSVNYMSNPNHYSLHFFLEIVAISICIVE